MKIRYPVILTILIVIGFYPQRSTAQWEKVRAITPSSYSTNLYLDVYFLPSNPQLGWICGRNGRILRTINGGDSWQGYEIGPAEHLESIQFLTPDIGYTSGPAPAVVYKSTDGGITWFDITPPTAARIWGLYFTDQDNGVVMGGGCDSIPSSEIYYTTDGGGTWNASTIVGQEFNTGYTDPILFTNNIGFAASSGRIWQTLDGGQTWNLYATTGTNVWHEEITISGATMAVPAAGTTCSGGGAGGGIRSSRDDGASWTEWSTGDAMYGAFMLDHQIGWACGINSAVWYTEDGGVSWEPRDCGIENDDLDDITFINDTTGWVVGEGVYRYLWPPYTLEKDTLDFQDVCIPEGKFDTLWIYNRWQETAEARITITGKDAADFEHISPPNPIAINACDSIPLSLHFDPLEPGEKSAVARVDLPKGVTLHFELVGKGIKRFTTPESDTVIINPARAGRETRVTLNWLNEGLEREYLDSVINLGAGDRIYHEHPNRFVIPVGESEFTFVAAPVDTGWIEERFEVFMTPCDHDTIITVRAYGVSPIITSSSSASVSLGCAEEAVKAIPVQNTGNAPLDILRLDLGGADPQDFIIEGWASGAAIPFAIEPGEADTILIRFKPSVGGAKNAELTIFNNDSTLTRGEQWEKSIRLFGSAGRPVFGVSATEFDFGEVCVGAAYELELIVQGDALFDGSFEADKVVGAESFEVIEPAAFPADVPGGGEVNMRIRFSPTQTGQLVDTLLLKFSPCDSVIAVAVRGVGITSQIEADPPSVTGRSIRTGTQTQVTILLRSIGANPLTIERAEDIVLLDNIIGNRTDWRFGYLPQLPLTLQPTEVDSVIIVFEPTQDTTYSGSLCITALLDCPTQICLPIEVQSLSTQLVVLSDIDFGLQICNATRRSASVTLRNDGTGEAIVDSLRLLNATALYTIDAPVQEPFGLKAGENIDVVVSGLQEFEGIAYDTLYVYTSQGGAKRVAIPIRSEFRTTLTRSADDRNDFGLAERCEPERLWVIRLENPGTLDDTVLITAQNGIPGFTITPADFAAIPAGDVTDIIVRAQPADFTTLGVIQETFEFISTVCPETVHSAEVSIEMIRPRLTVTPSAIDFGDVLTRVDTSDVIRLTNVSDYTLEVTGIELVPPDAGYRLGTLPQAPMESGENVEVEVFYRSETIRPSPARVRIVYGRACPDTAYVELNANAIDPAYTVEFSMDRYSVAPGDTVNMPVHFSGEILESEFSSITISVRHDFWLVQPIAVYAGEAATNGEIPFSRARDQGILTVTLNERRIQDIEEARFIKDTVVAFTINMIVFASEPRETDLIVNIDTMIAGRNVSGITSDGFLEIGHFCSIGLAQLQLIPTFITRLSSGLPSRNEIVADITSNGSIAVHAILQDMQGNTHYQDRALQLRQGITRVAVDTRFLPSGVYFLRVTSPIQTSTLKVLLVD